MIEALVAFFTFMRSIWLYWMLFWGGLVVLNIYLAYRDKKRKPGSRVRAK